MGGSSRPGRGGAVSKNRSLRMTGARNWVTDCRKLGISRFRRYLQPQSLVSGKQPGAWEDLEGVPQEFQVADKCSSWWGCGRGAGLLVTVLVLATVVIAFETCSNVEESPRCAARMMLGRLSELWFRSSGVVSAGGSGYAHGLGSVPVREGPEEATWVLRQLKKNGTDSCDKESTSRVMLFGMPAPQPGRPVQLRAGLVHELLLVSYTDNGTRRCGGGDYYETALEGGGWRSRPPLVDVGDGSYLLRLDVAEGITGGFGFKLVLLFGNYHGVDRGPDKWVLDKELLSFDIEFIAPPQQQQHRLHGGPSMELNQCSVSGGDFKLREWKGRWTRTAHNDSCTQPDGEGRYRCLPSDAPCDSAWCDGPVGSIDSNGWAYSAHCKFRIFQQEEAWSCLGSKWLLFWGDSNHQDTTRNLLNLVLGLDVGSWMRRSYDTEFPNPANSSQSLRITNIFAGHFNENGNNRGLSSLRNGTYLHRIQAHFAGDRVPDAVVLNSGLHDAYWWRNVTEYVEAADFTARFWAGLWKNATAVARWDSRPPPKVIYRTTVAPAGKSRSMNSNPQKMEAWNAIMVDRMLATGIPVQVVDAFDMTFPWHFDNNCSDGGHYGRPPSLKPWFGQIGHQYFVDLMVVHVLLNALCPLV